MTSKVRQFMPALFLLLASGIASCTGGPASTQVSKIPISRRGKMAAAVLALVERQNYIFDGDNTYTYADGLVFYFVIYPSGQRDVGPSIKQHQNFTVNGEPYWQNATGAYDSQTVIYNERTFAEHESQALSRVNIRRNANALIQKTVICGAALPPQGIVQYTLFFGFGRTLEEFEFRFDLRDIMYHSSN
jgi:hypothetical protein